MLTLQTQKTTLTILMMTLFLAGMVVSVIPAFALNAKFELDLDGDGVLDIVIRMPKKTKAGKNFNIGIYVHDSLVETNPIDGSLGDENQAELYVMATPADGGSITMWNSWFEEPTSTDANNLIDPTDDLIMPSYTVDPDLIVIGDEYVVTSMDYDVLSKLDDQDGWSGSIVCNASADTYEFQLKDSVGVVIVSFSIIVS